jgi:hypothetical protein
MTKQLKFPLLQGESITLQGGFDGSAADLSLLARLVHIRECQEQSGLLPEVVWCKNLQDADSKGVCVFQSKSLRVMYDLMAKFSGSVCGIHLTLSGSFPEYFCGIFR